MTTILIIDDDAELREIVRLKLEVDNYQVLDTESGESGVEIALEHKPDIILMDILMPGISGHEAIESLTKQGYGGMILALTNDKDFAKAKEVGAYDFLAKPLTPFFEKRVASLWAKFNEE
ncbi:MAG: response regulator [Magnetococcales bacterium]|nr:response regulator [Magnetococcales bacterium]